MQYYHGWEVLRNITIRDYSILFIANFTERFIWKTLSISQTLHWNYTLSMKFAISTEQTNKILISIQENSWIIISVSVKVNVLNLTYTLCRVFNLSMAFRTLVLIMRLIFSSTMDVYETPGKFGSYLSMTRHPGPTDFNELAVCLRFERFIIMCIIRQRI